MSSLLHRIRHLSGKHRCAIPRSCAAAQRPTGSRHTVGDIMSLHCVRLGHGGKGVCLLQDSKLVVFCEGALPGEHVEAELIKVQSRYLEARKVEILEQHDNAVESPCPYYASCGGCTLQALEYGAQTAAKRERLISQLTFAGRFPHAQDVVQPVIRYRNKTTFQYNPHQDGGCLGLSMASSNKTVPVSECRLQSDAANAILQTLETLLARMQIRPNTPNHQTGFLSRVVIREGTDDKATPRSAMESQTSRAAGLDASPPQADDRHRDRQSHLPVCTTDAATESAMLRAKPTFLINFVTAGPGERNDQAGLLWVTDELCRLHPSVVAVVHSVHTSKSSAAPHSSVVVLRGGRHVYLRIRHLLFQISAESFFQVNTSQAETLFNAVLHNAQLRPTDIVLDLYCGTGALALWMAPHCQRVLGIEMTQAAVDDARVNAQLNGIQNVDFQQGDLSQIRNNVTANAPKPDVIVVDPARAGLSDSLVRYMRNVMPRRIVYASCNEKTMCRDLRNLCSNDSGRLYHLQSVTPVDMFPQTDHLEAVATLDLATS